MHNPEFVQENEMQKILWFWDTNVSSNLSQTTRTSDSQQQIKRTCRIVDFAVPAEHRVNEKSVKKDKYLHFARELTNYGILKRRW